MNRARCEVIPGPGSVARRQDSLLWASAETPEAVWDTLSACLGLGAGAGASGTVLHALADGLRADLAPEASFVLVVSDGTAGYALRHGRADLLVDGAPVDGGPVLALPPGASVLIGEPEASARAAGQAPAYRHHLDAGAVPGAALRWTAPVRAEAPAVPVAPPEAPSAPAAAPAPAESAFEEDRFAGPPEPAPSEGAPYPTDDAGSGPEPTGAETGGASTGGFGEPFVPGGLGAEPYGGDPARYPDDRGGYDDGRHPGGPEAFGGGGGGPDPDATAFHPAPDPDAPEHDDQTGGFRPGLGVLVFEDGQTIPLHGDVVLGRRPDAHELVQSGQAQPVVIHDPDHVLSSSHAAIRFHGADVVVVDLDSLNGTHVAAPEAREWTKLTAGAPFRMQDGFRMLLGWTVLTYRR